MDKIGFLQTASGERSSTKLFNTVYGLALVGLWVALSWKKQEIIAFDPTVFVPLGLGQAWNALHKWIDANGNTEKAKMIKTIIDKVKK
jgi:hypothetical protein